LKYVALRKCFYGRQTSDFDVNASSSFRQLTHVYLMSHRPVWHITGSAERS